MWTDGQKNGQTDRRDEANIGFSQFCERAEQNFTISLKVI
jgi:hypothetical protein